MATTKASLSSDYLAADRSGKIVAAATAVLVLSTVLLGVRLWSRRFKDRSPGWDELMLLPCWILVVLSCMIDCIAVSHTGAGRHIEVVIKIIPGLLVTRGKLVYALSWFASVANVFSRLSILMLYLQMFRTRATRWATWFMIFYLGASFISCAVVTFVQTVPISYNWSQFEQPPAHGRTTIDLFLYYKLQGFSNVICDLLMLFFPVPVLSSLQQPFSQKFGLALVFASGSLGLVASLVRTVSFFTETHTWQTDPTWADVTLMTWITVESGMYLSAACLLGSRPFFARVPAFVETLSSSSRESWGLWRRRISKSDETPSETKESSLGAPQENSVAERKILVRDEFRVEHDSDEDLLRPAHDGAVWA